MTNQEIIRNHIALENSKITIASSRIKELQRNLRYWNSLEEAKGNSSNNVTPIYEEDEGVRGGLVQVK